MGVETEVAGTGRAWSLPSSSTPPFPSPGGLLPHSLNLSFEASRERDSLFIAWPTAGRSCWGRGWGKEGGSPCVYGKIEAEGAMQQVGVQKRQDRSRTIDPQLGTGSAVAQALSHVSSPSALFCKMSPPGSLSRPAKLEALPATPS